jgi:hypothetical protein
MITLLSQRDPRWSKMLLGAGPLTVGADGCLITSLCMFSDYCGKPITPNQPASHAECFDPNDEYQWNLQDFPFILEKRFNGRNDAEIRKSLADPKRGVILQVDNGRHFILALSRNWFGSYWCADPWFGDKCDAVRQWKNITGSRHLLMK